MQHPMDGNVIAITGTGKIPNHILISKSSESVFPLTESLWKR